MLKGSRRLSTSSRRLAALFLVVLVPAAATLVWLGVRLLEQDRRLWAERDLEKREAAADILVRELSQTLASAEESLSLARVPEGAVLARLSATAVKIFPPNGVLWTPKSFPHNEANKDLFTDA